MPLADHRIFPQFATRSPTLLTSTLAISFTPKDHRNLRNSCPAQAALKKAKNMKLLARILMSMAVVVGPSLTYASSEVMTRVVEAGTYGNGNVYVLLEATVNETGCARNAVELPASSVVAKSVLATAYSAIAMNKSVRVKSDSCYMGNPSLDSALRQGYFVIVN